MYEKLFHTTRLCISLVLHYLPYQRTQDKEEKRLVLPPRVLSIFLSKLLFPHSKDLLFHTEREQLYPLQEYRSRLCRTLQV